MSNADDTAPKQRRVIGVPFKPGQSGNPAGRPKGARSRLSSDFLADLHSAWCDLGADALRRCAAEEPGRFCSIVAGLMPRDIRIDQVVTVDATEFRNRFAAARSLLGNLPKVIDHAD